VSCRPNLAPARQAPFVVRQAGAGSLGYVVVAVLAQRALNRLELPLIIVMAGIFNGVRGLVSIRTCSREAFCCCPDSLHSWGSACVVCAIALRQVTR
jgi:hypothetical protein